jgi:hypothetical protein
LAPLEVDPQRLAEAPQQLKRFDGSAAQGHHGVEPQPTHHWVPGQLVKILPSRFRQSFKVVPQ